MAVPLFDTNTPLAPLRPDLNAKAVEVLDAGRYILGPEVAAFEEEFAAHLATPHATPANSPLTSLVYSARGTDAHTVFVDGEIVVRAGRLARGDAVDGVLAATRTRARDLIDKAGLRERLAPRWTHEGGMR